MNTLFVIPARGGSKGLPGKNIKALNGIPLLLYSLEYARLFAADKDICISTDDSAIAEVAAAAGYTLPFFRPEHLSNDTAGMREVLLHALEQYSKNGEYEAIVLLQPTSPFRKKEFLAEALEHFTPGTDMVVSVNQSKASPYFNLFEEGSEGYLQLSKPALNISRRQDAPTVYQYNGSIYIIRAASLTAYDSLASFPHIKKYLMPAEYNVDIDNEADWLLAEYLLNKNRVTTDGKHQGYSKA